MSNDEQFDNEKIKDEIALAETFINTFFENSNTTLTDIDENIKYLESIKIDNADLQTKLNYWIVLDKMKSLYAYINENIRNKIIDKILRDMLAKVEKNIGADKNDIDALKEFERNISDSPELPSQEYRKRILNMITGHIKLLEKGRTR